MRAPCGALREHVCAGAVHEGLQAVLAGQGGEPEGEGDLRAGGVATAVGEAPRGVLEADVEQSAQELITAVPCVRRRTPDRRPLTGVSAVLLAVKPSLALQDPRLPRAPLSPPGYEREDPPREVASQTRTKHSFAVLMVAELPPPTSRPWPT